MAEALLRAQAGKRFEALRRVRDELKGLIAEFAASH